MAFGRRRLHNHILHLAIQGSYKTINEKACASRPTAYGFWLFHQRVDLAVRYVNPNRGIPPESCLFCSLSLARNAITSGALQRQGCYLSAMALGQPIEVA